LRLIGSRGWGQQYIPWSISSSSFTWVTCPSLPYVALLGTNIYGWWWRALVESVSTTMGKPCRNAAPWCTRPAQASPVGAWLVGCFWRIQACRMQESFVWMVGQRAKPGWARATGASGPGSAETRATSVSRGPGSLGAMCTFKSEAGRRLDFDKPATKQELVAARLEKYTNQTTLSRMRRAWSAVAWLVWTSLAGHIREPITP
jgi:hypothetical protein